MSELGKQSLEITWEEVAKRNCLVGLPPKETPRFYVESNSNWLALQKINSNNAELYIGVRCTVDELPFPLDLAKAVRVHLFPILKRYSRQETADLIWESELQQGGDSLGIVLRPPLNWSRAFAAPETIAAATGALPGVGLSFMLQTERFTTGNVGSHLLAEALVYLVVGVTVKMTSRYSTRWILEDTNAN